MAVALAFTCWLIVPSTLWAQDAADEVSAGTLPPPPPIDAEAEETLEDDSQDASGLDDELTLDTVDDILEGKDQTGTPSLPPRDPQLAEPSGAPSAERVAPNYDGRASEAPDAGRILIWIPRVILYPVHLVFEYLLRWPFVNAITFLEKYKVIDRVINFLTWDEGNAGMFPVAFLDFGLNPSVGFVMYWDNFPARGNRVDLAVSFWSGGWARVNGRNSTRVFRDDSGIISIWGEYLSRPDLPFFGIGPDTSEDNESFYRLKRGTVGVGLMSYLGDLNTIAFDVVYRDVQFGTNANDPVVSAERSVDPALIPGFRSGYRLVDSRIRAEIDTREPVVAVTPGSGVRLELFGGFSFDPSELDTHFFRWGGELSGFLDFTGVNHVLALRIFTEFLTNTGDNEIPFTELASLGGTELMPAYFPGRMLGESAFESTLIYRYPVWSLLDAQFFAGVGNAFDEYLDGFAFDKLFLNFGGGLRSNQSRNVVFELLLGFGTNRLDSDTIEIDNIRFVLGTAIGF